MKAFQEDSAGIFIGEVSVGMIVFIVIALMLF